ncbi:MAG: TIM barrel protein [Bacteroidota bacterium]
MKSQSLPRRKFIATTATLATGALVGIPKAFSSPNILKYYGKELSVFKGVQVGVITYSYRSMPDQSAEATLQYVLDSGISAIELMGGPAESFAGMPQSPIDGRRMRSLRRKLRAGDITDDEKKEMTEMSDQMDHYNATVREWRSKAPLTKFEVLKKMYADAGVSIYCFKPGAFGTRNTDAEINYGMKAAKALGASHVTLEHPSNDDRTLKLGQMAAKHNIRVAYHGHTQQTPTFWDTALDQSDYNAMNIDVGHYVAAGYKDVLALLKEKNARISSMHLKDRKNKENGQDNLPWGQGDTPITEILKLMSTEGYKFPATVELEYKIPEGSDAVQEVRNCRDFCEKMLTS